MTAMSNVRCTRRYLLASVSAGLTGSFKGAKRGTRLVPRLGWPALGTNGVLQPQLARRPLHPLVFAERSAPLDAHPHAPQFLCAQRRIHAIGPIHGAFHRPRREDGLDRIFSM